MKAIIKFLNSTFAAWFFPSVVLVSLGIWIKECQLSADKKDLSNQIIYEINTRIKFAEERHDYCKDLIERNKNIWNDADYTDIFGNLLLPYPQYESIDSIDYSPKFRNESLPNLLFRLKTINKKYTKDVNKILHALNKVKDYYKLHKRINDSTYYYLTNIIEDSLHYIQIK